MKLIAQAAVGFFCVLIGGVYGIQTRDSLFVILSLVIGLGSLIRTFSFYRLIRSKSYRVLSGICTKRESMLFKKIQQVTLIAEDQRIYFLSLNKNARLFPGHYYQLYFRQSSIPDTSYDNSLSDYLGYEEIPVIPEKDCGIVSIIDMF